MEDLSRYYALLKNVKMLKNSEFAENYEGNAFKVFRQAQI